MKRIYNWKPSPPDARDFAFKASRPHLDLPPAADVIRPLLPDAWDQGDLGSCVAHAVGMAAYFGMQLANKIPFQPSRLQIYHDARAIEGAVRQDAGCYGRDAIKVLAKLGTAPEPLWPYDVAKFAKKPPKPFYIEAAKTKATRYERVKQTLPELRYALHRGYPVAFGIAVFDSFESEHVARTGDVPMPGANERNLGGHEILMIGYDDARQAFRFRNSWGDWGDAGDGWLPYAYALEPNLADDFQTFWM